MGLFDKAKAAKEEHARQEEARRQEAERAKIEAENKRNRQIEYIQEGELAQSVLNWIDSWEWFLHSQGSWDSNRRQVIICNNMVFINNFDDPYNGADYFFSKLRDANNHKGNNVTYSHQRNYKTFPEGTLPDEDTMKLEDVLDRYKGVDYDLQVFSIEDSGFTALSESDLQLFSQAIYNFVMQKQECTNRNALHKNSFGFWAFEFFVNPVKLKSILPDELK